MKDRKKDNTPGSGRALASHRRSSRDTGFTLEDALIQFSLFCESLYRHIQQDLNARPAFEKMTSGRKAIDASVFLSWLGAEAYASTAERQTEKPASRYANESQEKWAWEKWKDALEGLQRNAKTLRRVSRQMKAYLAEGRDDLPGEWGYSMRPPRGQIYQALFTHIPRSAIVLSQFAEKLQECSNTLEAYCSLGKVWQQVAAQAKEVEIQRTFALLCSVKQQTGHCQFEKMAPLISVGRRLSRRRKETAESLRSMWRRQSESQKHTFGLHV